MRITVDQVIELIADVLGTSAHTITADAVSSDIPKWDSLNHIQICLALEERFKVSIPMEKMLELSSVPDIHKFLNA